MRFWRGNHLLVPFLGSLEVGQTRVGFTAPSMRAPSSLRVVKSKPQNLTSFGTSSGLSQIATMGVFGCEYRKSDSLSPQSALNKSSNPHNNGTTNDRNDCSNDVSTHADSCQPELRMSRGHHSGQSASSSSRLQCGAHPPVTVHDSDANAVFFSCSSAIRAVTISLQ